LRKKKRLTPQNTNSDKIPQFSNFNLDNLNDEIKEENIKEFKLNATDFIEYKDRKMLADIMKERKLQKIKEKIEEDKIKKDDIKKRFRK